MTSQGPALLQETRAEHKLKSGLVFVSEGTDVEELLKQVSQRKGLEFEKVLTAEDEEESSNNEAQFTGKGSSLEHRGAVKFYSLAIHRTRPSLLSETHVMAVHQLR